jgi:hypothetical protein
MAGASPHGLRAVTVLGDIGILFLAQAGATAEIEDNIN